MATVAVVGGGPAGAATALALCRAGHRVELLEARPGDERRWRGEALMPSGLEALARLGVMDPTPTLPLRPLASWAMLLDGQLFFDAAEPLGSAAPCSLVPQPPLLAALLEDAAATGRLGQPAAAMVQGLHHRQGRVAGVHLADGRSIDADLVIAADGRDSRLRRQAGLALVQERCPISLLWFELNHPCLAPLEHWLGGRFLTVLARCGSFALFRSARGPLQLGWVLRPGEMAREPVGGWPALWASGLPREPATALAALPRQALAAPASLSVRVGLAPVWHRPGLLLLGDAAHPMSPLRAQGSAMALRDGVEAARLLAPALATGRVGAIDAALPAVAAARLPEIRAVQALQRQEAARGALLGRQPLLRRWLLLNRSWSGPLAQRIWSHHQRRLRDGLRPLPAQP